MRFLQLQSKYNIAKKTSNFWPTVLSVVPLARCVVCLSVCRLSVLYCGETIHPSEKVSEGVNTKPGSKS